MGDQFSFVVRDGDIQITLNGQELLNVTAVSLQMESGDSSVKINLTVNTRYVSVVSDSIDMEIEDHDGKKLTDRR